jgi:hypothetical protein
LTPHIEIKTPAVRREIVQPSEQTDYAHGNVVATLSENFEITAQPTSIKNGACVALKSVAATVGYNDFTITIDGRHARNSCTYNAILKHELEHVKIYQSVIDDYSEQIMAAVQSAADSATPIFAPSANDTENALDAFHRRIQQNPEIILLRQKIQAEQEIRNKKFDRTATSDILKECR